MTLEVRQLVLKSTVVDDDDDEDDNEGGQGKAGGCGGAEGDCEDREQLKEEILAECRVWLLEQLAQLKER